MWCADIIVTAQKRAGNIQRVPRAVQVSGDRQNGNGRFAGDATDDFRMVRAGLQVHATDDIMLFGTYATGHKGQTFGLTSGFNQLRADAGPVRPEESRDWEVGARTQFFDRRFTFTITAFDTRYRDFQAQRIEVLPDGSNNFRLTNVGRLRTHGVEVDTLTRMGRNLNLAASAIYLDATITSSPFAQCYPGQTAAQGCLGTPAGQNLTGTRPPQAPEWKVVAANLDDAHLLGSLPVGGVLQLAYSYQSAINF